VLLTAAVAQAQGFNMTGTWSGTVTCRPFDGTTLFVPRAQTQLEIVHHGTSLVARFTDGSRIKDFNGFAVAQVNASKVRTVLAECRSTTGLDGYAEFVHVSAWRGARARMKARSIFRDHNGQIGTCRWKFSRLDEIIPVLSGCP
jgi:hypothetical protein